VNDLPRDREILLICHSGRRSAQAAHLLLKAGHSAVNVAGGMQAWTQAGLPLSR
jgi:rhodanese-related sulfurtransferase